MSSFACGYLWGFCVGEKTCVSCTPYAPSRTVLPEFLEFSHIDAPYLDVRPVVREPICATLRLSIFPSPINSITGSHSKQNVSCAHVAYARRSLPRRVTLINMHKLINIHKAIGCVSMSRDFWRLCTLKWFTRTTSKRKT